MATARRNSQVAVAEEEAVGIPAGSIIRNIEAELRMGTEEPQTNLAVRHEETPFPIARLVPGSRLAGRAEICRAIVAELV